MKLILLLLVGPVPLLIEAIIGRGTRTGAVVQQHSILPQNHSSSIVR